MLKVILNPNNQSYTSWKQSGLLGNKNAGMCIKTTSEGKQTCSRCLVQNAAIWLADEVLKFGSLP